MDIILLGGVYLSIFLVFIIYFIKKGKNEEKGKGSKTT